MKLRIGVLLITIFAILLTSCSAPAAKPEVIEKTVIVEGSPQVIEKEVIQNVVVTATPGPVTDSHYGGTFIAGITFGDPATLNPINCDSYTCGQILGLVFSRLVKKSPDGKMEPDLAESWEFTEENKVLTMHIREDANWTDGQPVTAADVVFTLEAKQKPDTTYTALDSLSVAGEPIQFEAVDEKTVKLTMAESYGPILDVLGNGDGMWILPQHLVNADDPLAGSFNQNPIGSGAFKFVEYKQGESVTVEANEDYYGGRPYLDRVVFRLIPSSDSAVVALQSGEIDVTEISFTQIPQLQGNRDIVVMPDTSYDHGVEFRLNVKSPILSNKLVRQALNIATDREEYIWGVWGGYAEPMNSMFDKSVFCWDADQPVLPEYDIEAAKALLEEAGWKDEDGNGIREAHGVEGVEDGTPFSFELLTYSAARYGAILPIAQAQWKEIGLDLKVRILDSAGAFEIINAFGHDMYVGGWGSMGNDPNNYRSMWGVGNTYQYNNPAADELWDTGAAEVDEAKRKVIYDQLEDVFAEDLPIIPIGYDYAFVAARYRVVFDEAIMTTNNILWSYYPEKLYITQE